MYYMKNLTSVCLWHLVFVYILKHLKVKTRWICALSFFTIFGSFTEVLILYLFSFDWLLISVLTTYSYFYFIFSLCFINILKNQCSSSSSFSFIWGFFRIFKVNNASYGKLRLRNSAETIPFFTVYLEECRVSVECN